MDFLGVICVLGILLAIVTVVGHGIWVFVAMLLRGLSDEPPAKHSGRVCRSCGAAFAVGANECPICGTAAMSPADSSPNLKQDLYATTRLLGYLHDKGAVDDALHATLAQVIKDEHAQLSGVRVRPVPFVPPVFAPTESPGHAAASPPPLVEIEFVNEPVGNALRGHGGRSLQDFSRFRVKHGRILARIMHGFRRVHEQAITV
jgi:hypothetical protein